MNRSRKADDLSFLFYLPFTIESEEAIIYASILDYSGQAGLGVNIIRDSDQEDDTFEVVSVPSKYFNYIPPVSLTRGKYYLGIIP